MPQTKATTESSLKQLVEQSTAEPENKLQQFEDMERKAVAAEVIKTTALVVAMSDDICRHTGCDCHGKKICHGERCNCGCDHTKLRFGREE